jgi:hypothetical protein
MNIDVDGKGFTEKYLNTGVRDKIEYNKYTYNNIVVDGYFKIQITKEKYQ